MTLAPLVIYPDGHIFFCKETIERREIFNEAIANIVSEFPQAHLVELRELGRECYEDSVHFNEQGNVRVAEIFSEVLINL